MSPSSIIADVCARHRVGRKDIVGGSRVRHVVAARNELCSLLRGISPEISFPRIGWLVGLHHANVIRAIRRHERSAP